MVRGQTQSLLIMQNNNLNRWRAYGAWIDGPLRRTEDCSAVPFPKYCTFNGLVSKLVPKIGALSKAKRSKSWVVYCNWLSSGASQNLGSLQCGIIVLFPHFRQLLTRFPVRFVGYSALFSDWPWLRAFWTLWTRTIRRSWRQKEGDVEIAARQQHASDEDDADDDDVNEEVSMPRATASLVPFPALIPSAVATATATAKAVASDSIRESCICAFARGTSVPKSDFLLTLPFSVNPEYEYPFVRKVQRMRR